MSYLANRKSEISPHAALVLDKLEKKVEEVMLLDEVEDPLLDLGKMYLA